MTCSQHGLHLQKAAAKFKQNRFFFFKAAFSSQVRKVVLVTQFNEPQNFFKLLYSVPLVQQDHGEPVFGFGVIMPGNTGDDGLNLNKILNTGLFTKLRSCV